MDRQPHVCVIDWFGVSYDGTMPNIDVRMRRDLVWSFPGRAAESLRPWSLPTGGMGSIFSIDKISQSLIVESKGQL
jgi:hypothetical protein